MLSIIGSWIYIFLICLLIGTGALSLIDKKKFPLSSYVVAGIVVITVYVEYFSIFAKIGAFAHGILFVAAAVVGYRSREKIRELGIRYRSVLFSWEGFFYVCFVLLISFFASRGEFHTDTNIYHAASIRIYEEYGLIKGLGNLQLHYAYNSSYLAFASIFSFRWLFGRSLHTTTGFLEVLMCLYAFHGLKDFKQHKNHIPDMMRVGILLYTLFNVTRSMSPVTDYAVLYFVFYILCAWCENLFEGNSDVSIYSLLSVAAVFSTTMKFSASLLVLLVIYPACCLIKEKKWREIGVYISCGCVILVPFLVRNYFISGWLLYPFEKIDIFNPVWKIPEKYLLHDANQIKVWGRCLYDVEKIDMPIRQWLPVWWDHQLRHERMFIGAVVIGLLLQLVIVFHRIWKRRKPEAAYVVLHIAIWANIGVWFFMAPFIRYGLAFLIAVIMIALGEYLGEEKKGFYSILTGSLVFGIVVSVSPYWDQYVTDAGVFVKQSLRDPYYLVQKDYDQCDMEKMEVNGNEIWYSVEGEVNSYHVFPATCYKYMMDRSTLLGDRIEDGLRAKTVDE